MNIQRAKQLIDRAYEAKEKHTHALDDEDFRILTDALKENPCGEVHIEVFDEGCGHVTSHTFRVSELMSRVTINDSRSNPDREFEDVVRSIVSEARSIL